VAEDRDRVARVARERLGDCGDVLEFALDRVGEGVARRAAPPSIDGVDGEPARQARTDDPERGVIGGGAVDQDQRWPVAAAEDGDRRPVRRTDPP
jgi:hypothetical protein